MFSIPPPARAGPFPETLDVGLRKVVVLAVSLPGETDPVCRRPFTGGSRFAAAHGGCLFYAVIHVSPQASLMYYRLLC